MYGVSDIAVDLANANDITKMKVMGLVATNIIEAGGAGIIALLGKISGSTTQWDSITGQAGGLTPNANYFLDIVGGMITNSAPLDRAAFLCPIGSALSETVLNINIGKIIQL